MKQTSIDWLVSVLAHNDIIDHKLLSTREDKYKLYKRLVEQAKKMHKEEHGKTWDDSLDNFKARGMNEMRAYSDFDDYYNETFKQNKQ